MPETDETPDDDQPPHARPPQRPIFGISLKILSALAFTAMAAIVKYITSGGLAAMIPLGEIVFFRSLFALLPVLLWLAYARPLSAAFATNNLKGHIKRGFISSTGMFLGFAGLQYLPLPDATALSYAAPLLNVFLAWLILKEVIRIYRWAAVLIGFVGVIIMLVPYMSMFSGGGGNHPEAWKGVSLALAAAMCSAFAVIEVRKLTATEHTGAIVVYFSLMTTVLSLITFAVGQVYPAHAWVWPPAKDFAVLAAIGFLGGIGQILLTHSYRFADASVIAPFDYTSMIWALLIGWLVFDQLPDSFVLVGAVVVIASGIFVILRERALGIERRRQREAAPTRTL